MKPTSRTNSHLRSDDGHTHRWHSGEYDNGAKLVGKMSKSVMQLISIHFYSTPSTEGVESTRGNFVCLSVCLFVRHHFFLLRIFNDLMV